MISATDLKTLLNAYDNAIGASILLMSPEDTRRLSALRMLARGASPDLSGPLGQMFKSFSTPLGDWAGWTAFEKMVAIIGNKSNVPSCAHITAEQYLEFLGETMAMSHSSAVGSAVEEQSSANDLAPWLMSVMKSITDQLGGSVILEANLSYGKQRFQLNVVGTLPMKYSVFMTLRNIGAISIESPTKILSAEHIEGNLILVVDSEALVQAFIKAKNLSYVQSFLQRSGFTVEVGSKACSQVLTSYPDFHDRNDIALKTKFNFDLAVANALNQSRGNIVLPFSLKILTYADRLMLQLESYYAHPMANLKGSNGLLKTFITETRAPGLLHESNLDLSQMLQLRDFFERLEFFAQSLGKSSVEITEEEMIVLTEKFYGGMVDKRVMEKMVESWNKPYDFLQSGTAAALSASSSAMSSSESQSLSLVIRNTCAESVSRKSGQHRIGVAAFEKRMEKYLNDTLIPGPHYFLGDNPLFRSFEVIYANAEDSVQSFIQAIEGSLPSTSALKKPETHSLIAYKDDYQVDTRSNCRTPRSPIPMELYARASARSCMEGGRALKLSDISSLHKQGVDWLNKTVDRETNGAAAAQPLVDFYAKNNPYYIIDNAISHLKTFLDDQRCTEMHVSRVLEMLGVKKEDQPLYQMAEHGYRFNRFQIKFFLFPLVLNKLLEQNILLPIGKLCDMRHPWVAQTVIKDNVKQAPTYMNSPVEWRSMMVGWKSATTVKGIEWSAGGPRVEIQKKVFSTAAGTGTIFGAGGSSAGIKKVTPTTEPKDDCHP